MAAQLAVSAATGTLAPERQALLHQLSEGLDAQSLAWTSGYFAGLAAARNSSPVTGPIAAKAPEAGSRATVLYASQTGNGRRIAESLALKLESHGVAVRVQSTADYAVRDISQERLLFVIASTHGDGDAPDDARGFNDFLFGRRAGRLEQLAFSVLALGDSSYPQFCVIGRKLDAQFAALGGRRLTPCVDCDVDYDAKASRWVQTAVEAAQAELHATPRLAVVTALRTPALIATREQPFDAEVLAVQRISARGSDKLVTHLELAAPAQRLAYEPGDAVAIWPRNPAETIAQVIRLLTLQSDSATSCDGRTQTLREWLAGEREITRLTRPFIEAHAARSGSAALRTRLTAGNGDGLRELLRSWQLVDLLRHYPADWSAEELVGALRPLTPRLYSIASSRMAVGDELHLAVAAIDYEFDGERRYGSASRHLSTLEQASSGDGQQSLTVRAYVEANERFRLPTDPQRNVIMIGPGTGVAPFRGFLQQRIATGASGRNWLFFGARHAHSDFLYQSEWLDARRRGTLHRLDVAFSRDQAAKVYVQDRLREHGADLYRWLRDGAHLYVCGDASNMAPDVHTALIDIAVTHGGQTREDAAAFLNTLSAERRYARDVY